MWTRVVISICISHGQNTHLPGWYILIERLVQSLSPMINNRRLLCQLIRFYQEHVTLIWLLCHLTYFFRSLWMRASELKWPNECSWTLNKSIRNHKMLSSFQVVCVALLTEAFERNSTEAQANTSQNAIEFKNSRGTQLRIALPNFLLRWNSHNANRCVYISHTGIALLSLSGTCSSKRHISKFSMQNIRIQGMPNEQNTLTMKWTEIQLQRGQFFYQIEFIGCNYYGSSTIQFCWRSKVISFYWLGLNSNRSLIRTIRFFFLSLIKLEPDFMKIVRIHEFR